MEANRVQCRPCALIVGGALICGIGLAFAAEEAKRPATSMDEPMSGEMKKQGMKQGDVKNREANWDRKMKAMIKKEEETSAQAPAKK